MKKRLIGFVLALILVLGWTATAHADLGSGETMRQSSTSIELIEPYEPNCELDENEEQNQI